MMAKRADTPGAANDLLKKIRILIRFAIVNGIRRDDPTLKMKKFKAGEFHTWTEEEIAQFEQRWPVGSTERLAFAVQLFSGQRVSDAPTWIGRSGYRHDPRHSDQDQGQARNPIAFGTCNYPGRLCSQRGGAHSYVLRQCLHAEGARQLHGHAIGKAELPERCVTHGLRKAAARRLAEAGCSVHEIMAITGHRTLAEVERYTKAAEQKRLARVGNRSALIAVGQRGFPNPDDGLGKTIRISGEINAEPTGWRSLRESNPSFQIENLTS